MHLHVAVLCALCQHRHGGQVAHAMGHYVPLLVAGEPVQGQVQARLVVGQPPVLVVHPCGYRRMLLRPVWYGVVLCAEGAVTRRQWPGCLPTGTGKREGCVYSVRTVCKCVVIGGKRGVGETWMSPTRRMLSSQKFPLYSLCLRLLVQA